MKIFFLFEDLILTYLMRFLNSHVKYFINVASYVTVTVFYLAFKVKNMLTEMKIKELVFNRFNERLHLLIIMWWFCGKFNT